MFRSNISRALCAQRGYSTQPTYTSADFEKLLERVKSLTTKPPTRAKTLQKNNQRQYKYKAKSQQQRGQQGEQSQASDASTVPVSQRKPQQQRLPRKVTGDLNDFSDVASDFVKADASKPFQKKSFNNNNRPAQRKNRGPQLTNKLRDISASSRTPSTPKQRTQRRKRTGEQSQKPRTPRAISRGSVNPNVKLINTVYIPQPPTLDSLLATSPLTSQSAESRILKAYRELQSDSLADISGVLNGKFKVASESPFASKLTSEALKRNADVVVTSLNKNSTLDYETKMKLLMPLSGVAPVKQLTS